MHFRVNLLQENSISINLTLRHESSGAVSQVPKKSRCVSGKVPASRPLSSCATLGRSLLSEPELPHVSNEDDNDFKGQPASQARKRLASLHKRERPVKQVTSRGVSGAAEFTHLSGAEVCTTSSLPRALSPVPDTSSLALPSAQSSA